MRLKNASTCLVQCSEHTEVSSPAAWIPSPAFIDSTNIAWLMREVGVDSYQALHAWSVENREAYWELAIERLGIRFQKAFSRVADFSAGVENPSWLVGARMNIVESCFLAPSDSTAIIYQTEDGELKTVSVSELADLTNRVAGNLHRLGYKPGDVLAMMMPMTVESVAIYLGIIKTGCVVAGIADSFQPREIVSRLRLSNAAAVFTQDVILRGGKALPLYAKVIEASSLPVIMLTASDEVSVSLRSGDCHWTDFLKPVERNEAVGREPSDPVNILFSSGTTGDPKVIPWTQTTPIKCAADAHFHQNIQPGDDLVWPTNIGWMMGPWLIFASLLNRAAMGLYYDAPTGSGFCRFVQEAKTTMLGVVPSLVRTWRNTGCTDGADWRAIKVFSSTGECSNAADMQWLMEQGGCKPVIEYCGGTEIGGAYLTSTVTLPCAPGVFNTPALGLDVVILDEDRERAETGELFIVPPSIGLSSTLLNGDHHKVYFADVPAGPNGEILRRHGDQMERLPCGGWRALGRADDTMNLGGIKVSSAEIEHVLRSIPNVSETAAIAVSPGGGPSSLVIYAVCSGWDKEQLAAAMQAHIKRDLNPLFKIQDVVIIDAMPRTASNKVMRRELRDRYLKQINE